MLTNKQIDGAKPTGRAFKLADLDGLYLYVSPTGTKSWRFNFKLSGRQQTKTYGRYPLMGIAEARRVHHDFKYRDGTEAESTFREVAEQWMKIHLPKLRNIKHQKQIASTLEQFVYPSIGGEKSGTIKRKALASVVQAIDERGTVETAHRVAGRIKQVFDYAVDIGEIENNPAVGLTRVLRTVVSKPMTALPMNEVPDLLRAIQGYDEPVSRLGLLLLAHTFVRTRELTLARWEEFDLKNKVWVIPESRMKLKRPHVVPLSRQVLSLLEDVASLTFSSGLLLESPVRRKQSISENTLLFALYRLGYRGRMTGHGFRSVASSALNESGLWQAEAIERQLAHKEADDVRAAYNRAEYFDQRVRMMQWWSDQLDNFLQT